MKVVCLDPGHGYNKAGKWTGATANGLREDLLVLDFAERLGHYLRARGMTVRLTRTDHYAISLRRRAQIALACKADLMLSLHTNAATNPQANGAEAYVAKGDRRSEAVAKDLLHAIPNMRLRGVKPDSQSQHRRLAVLQYTYRHMLAVLLELGFLTNHADATRLASRRWREDTACLLARKIVACQA